VTHVHPDHYTQAVAVRREYATQVVLGQGELPALKRLLDPGWDAISPSALQLEAAGAGELVEELRSIGYGQSHERDAYALPDQAIGDGDEVEIEAGRLLVAMHTPGHTRGHMVFVDHGAGLIFAGDHVLPHITPSIGFEADPGEMPLGDYLNSLARVRSLPDLALLPAHGPVTQSVHARVDEIIDHHRERLDLCVNALVSGAETGYEVARRLPWTRRGTPFDQLDAFNRMLATTETLAHLRLLRSQGLLALNIESGVERFVPSAHDQEAR
jgi:glyoxylase-like metal-dependent hydrolase (beta-lactamase superfamily II)